MESQSQSSVVPVFPLFSIYVKRANRDAIFVNLKPSWMFMSCVIPQELRKIVRLDFTAKKGRKRKGREVNHPFQLRVEHMCEIKLIMDDDVEMHEYSLNRPASVSSWHQRCQEDCVFQFLLRNPLWVTQVEARSIVIGSHWLLPKGESEYKQRFEFFAIINSELA